MSLSVGGFSKTLKHLCAEHIVFSLFCPHVKKKNYLIFYKPRQRTLDHKPETHRTSSSLSSFSENKINLSNGFAAMLLLLLSHFSSVWLVATLWTIAHQALHPWDSPSKNTGVGCHSLLQGIFPTQGSNPRLMSPALAGRFLTTNITYEAPLGSLSFFQGIFPTQGLNPAVSHCRWIIYQLSHKGSPLLL